MGQTPKQKPQPTQWSAMKEICGEGERLSGLWHQRQLRGQPLRKTVVRIPGPSWMENFWMSKTRPCMADHLPLCGVGIPAQPSHGCMTPWAARGRIALSELKRWALGGFLGRCPKLMDCAPLGLKKAYHFTGYCVPRGLSKTGRANCRALTAASPAPAPNRPRRCVRRWLDGPAVAAPRCRRSG